jgi:hypothetical protein
METECEKVKGEVYVCEDDFICEKLYVNDC